MAALSLKTSLVLILERRCPGAELVWTAVWPKSSSLPGMWTPRCVKRALRSSRPALILSTRPLTVILHLGHTVCASSPCSLPFLFMSQDLTHSVSVFYLFACLSSPSSLPLPPAPECKSIDSCIFPFFFSFSISITDVFPGF